MSEFDISLYNNDFFAWHWEHARNYSILTMNDLINQFQIESVVDFGCGIGSYLESAFQKGIDPKGIKGYDIGGEHAKLWTPTSIQHLIEYRDCTEPIKTSMKYDCVISFETAEHIDPKGNDIFVKNICDAVTKTGFILFTAAPPGQDGCGHINCHEKSFWLEKFENHKIYENQFLTLAIKDRWRALNVGCPDYILNNLIVMKKR